MSGSQRWTWERKCYLISSSLFPMLQHRINLYFLHFTLNLPFLVGLLKTASWAWLVRALDVTPQVCETAQALRKSLLFRNANAFRWPLCQWERRLFWCLHAASTLFQPTESKRGDWGTGAGYFKATTEATVLLVCYWLNSLKCEWVSESNSIYSRT